MLDHVTLGCYRLGQVISLYVLLVYVWSGWDKLYLVI